MWQPVYDLNQTSRRTEAKLWEGSAAFHLCHFFPSDRHAARISKTCCDPSVHNAHALIPTGCNCPGLSPSWVPQPAGNSHLKETLFIVLQKTMSSCIGQNKSNVIRTKGFLGIVWETSFVRIASVQPLSDTRKNWSGDIATRTTV